MNAPFSQTRDSLCIMIADRAGGMVADLRPFAVGNNARLYLADMQDGRRLIVKTAARRAAANLDVEGWMLGYLRARSSLPVPEVIAAEPEALIMTYLPNASVLDDAAQIEAAEMLAALHAVRGRVCGLERDTLIGGLHQPNQQDPDWLTFFRDHRLLYMARAALDENCIDGKLMAGIEKLAGRLGQMIDASPAAPSLLHGDIWAGNVLSVPGRITGFIDPAIYYGDPEIELAFIALFGTFGKPFFRRYGEISPIRDGFLEVRKDIYSLYPLLVHARLFGRAYADAARQIVLRLAA